MYVIIYLLACSSIKPRTMTHACECRHTHTHTHTHPHTHAHEQLEDKAVSSILPSQYPSHTDYLVNDGEKGR